jgi:outer membrane protein, multidrug efflux system
MKLLLLLVAMLLSACSGRQPVKKAAIAPAPAFTKTAPAPAVPVDLQEWWKSLGDETLNGIMSQVLADNLDLRVAAQRIDESRAANNLARANLMPRIDSTSSVLRLRGGFAQGINRTGINPASPNSRSTVLSAFETGVFTSGLEASWEADVFGGLKREARATALDVNALEEARRDIMVLLTAEAATNYANLRGAQRQHEITLANIKAQADTKELTAVRVNAGLATDLDLTRASAQLAVTESALPLWQQTVEVAAHRLALLCGQQPGALLEKLSKPAPLPQIAEPLSAGLPSELLQRRPDIRRVEKEIAAADLRAAAARTEYFPRFTLNGNMGRQGQSVPGLSLGAGNFFSAGPGLRIPLFNFGRIRQNVAASDSRVDQAITRYEQLILSSTEEVENALTGVQQLQLRSNKLREAIEENRRAVALANELHLRGLGDFLSVLDAQRQLYDAEDALAQTQTNTFLQAIALYRSLGGGWR